MSHALFPTSTSKLDGTEGCHHLICGHDFFELLHNRFMPLTVWRIVGTWKTHGTDTDTPRPI